MSETDAPLNVFIQDHFDFNFLKRNIYIRHCKQHHLEIIADKIAQQFFLYFHVCQCLLFLIMAMKREFQEGEAVGGGRGWVIKNPVFMTLSTFDTVIINPYIYDMLYLWHSILSHKKSNPRSYFRSFTFYLHDLSGQFLPTKFKTSSLVSFLPLSP